MRAFTHRCVISITDRLVMKTGKTVKLLAPLAAKVCLVTNRVKVFTLASDKKSAEECRNSLSAAVQALIAQTLTQCRMDRVQQGGTGKRLFQQSYTALQHLTLGDQFPGVTRHIYDFQRRV